MPTTAQFEEKQYEILIANEFALKNQNVWPTGQVLEKYVGFDTAFRVSNRVFWKLWGGGFRQGAIPAWRWWRRRPPSDRTSPSQSQLPDFKVNLFLQHKRPELLSKGPVKQWKRWKKPFYRFHIDGEQQQVLTECAKGLGKHGLVAYSSPAFHTIADLRLHSDNHELIKHSNFVETAKLKGHKSYTYTEPGKKGIAFSEPEEIDAIDLSEELARKHRELGTDQPRDFNLLTFTARVIENSTQGSDVLSGKVLDQFTEDVLADDREATIVRDSPYVIAYIRIVFFAWAYNIDWLPYGVIENDAGARRTSKPPSRGP